MSTRLGQEHQGAMVRVLGYLNFSSGTPDVQFRRDWNQLYAAVAQQNAQPWVRLPQELHAQLDHLAQSDSAFADPEQAKAVLKITFGHLLPLYREFHRDLLGHLKDQELFVPFFLVKALEAVLQEGPPWDAPDQVAQAALERLNCFIGYRPVAVLENGRQMQPYAHEWVCPLPLYFREVGTAWGPYQRVVELALQILRNTPEEILDQACLDLDRLDELAVDPRAFDFEHPVARRLNYQFGQWDPHCIDNQGYYRRYVITDVTLQGLMERLQEPGDPEELLFEAAAVLAGTILMGSATSGWGPGCYDSSVTLPQLVPRIAQLRDRFYEHLLSQVPGEHGQRLRREAQLRHQPFAAARQGFNQALMRYRAQQLQRTFLARLLSRMGYPEASARQWKRLRPASARIRGQLDCLLTSAQLALRRGELDQAHQLLQQAEDVLHRGVECGALMDPWNVLGFGGQFPLFHTPESAVYDYRIDQLVGLMEWLFQLLGQLESEAAVAQRPQLHQAASAQAHALAAWWDQFGTTSVQQVVSFSGEEAARSADQVAQALAAWHQAGSAAGDVAFWQPHAQKFRSPKAYARVVKTLLDHGDLRASMALLMHWLSREDVPLQEGEFAFTPLAFYWMNQLRRQTSEDPQRTWREVVRFFDYLEANGEHRARVPDLLAQSSPSPPQQEETSEEEDLFAAAYEGVVFRDSAWDGVEGEVDPGTEPSSSDFELELLGEQIRHSLMFFGTMAELWSLGASVAQAPQVQQVQDHIFSWIRQAENYHQRLHQLVEQLVHYPIEKPSSVDPLAMAEFDRRQSIRQGLLEQVVQVLVMMRWARIKLQSMPGLSSEQEKLPRWQQQATRVVALINAQDAPALRKAMPQFREALAKLPLLYLPLERGGDPFQLAQVRLVHGLLRALLMALPRLGLLAEAGRLLELAKAMESNHMPGRGAISEFDRLFSFGCQHMVEALVRAAKAEGASDLPPEQSPLVDCLDTLSQRLVKLWVHHAHTLRISVLEALDAQEVTWRELVEFVRRYGKDLFTPLFLSDGNLRAVARQGTRNYLRQLRRLAEEGEESLPQLASALDRDIPLERAAVILDLIVHTVLENYAEYNDYNHTTIQSDRGELLYMFLDFLRVKVAYQRQAWDLTPLVVIHQVLVQHQQHAVAAWWRNMLQQRTQSAAQRHLRTYEELVRRYGMKLTSVEELLRERFLAPLQIDQVAAWLPLLMDEKASGEEKQQWLSQFEEQIEELLESYQGTGLELPPWAVALEQELERIQVEQLPELAHRRLEDIPWQKVSLRQLHRDIRRWNPQTE